MCFGIYTGHSLKTRLPSSARRKGVRHQWPPTSLCGNVGVHPSGETAKLRTGLLGLRHSSVRHPLRGKTANQYAASMTGQSDTLQAVCRICPYSAGTDASIDPECRQFRRVVRRMKLNAIPLPESWLPELLGASAADLCLSPMASPLAERPFSVASLDCVRFCCGPAGLAPQALVGQDALPPPPVLGYSNTLFLAPSVPRLEKLSSIPLSHF